jgi:hypothetical protein
MIIIKKIKDNEYSLNYKDISLVLAQKEAVGTIDDLLINRYKSLLYTKNENAYIRFMAKFLLKNKDISKYNRIEIMDLGDLLGVSLYVDDISVDRFSIIK